MQRVVPCLFRLQLCEIYHCRKGILNVTSRVMFTVLMATFISPSDSSFRSFKMVCSILRPVDKREPLCHPFLCNTKGIPTDIIIHNKHIHWGYNDISNSTHCRSDSLTLSIELGLLQTVDNVLSWRQVRKLLFQDRKNLFLLFWDLLWFHGHPLEKDATWESWIKTPISCAAGPRWKPDISTFSMI